MKALAFFLLAAAAVAVPRPAAADSCSLDDEPAATLLLPYFEVDLDNPNGLTTLFTINNASAAAVLTNVVLWSDLGVRTYIFPIYLTGYDSQSFNLRDLFNGGALPQTASAGQDTQDSVSPKGPYSQDIDFASCTGQLPPPPLPQAFIAHLRASHTGKASALLGGCVGRDLGDGVLRGYVTIDTVNQCGFKTPADPGYFGPNGVATDQNVLWGDFLYVDSAKRYADGENLVRIQSFPGAFHPGDQTFYGRYVGNSGIDSREPLATRWATRFAVGGAFSGGTDLIVWRDSGVAVEPFPCGTLPAGFPLRMASEVTFDEQENPQPALPRPAADAFPGETNLVHVGSSTFPVAFNFGWLFLDLNVMDQGVEQLHQSWVGTVMKAQGRFSVGFNATPLDSACNPLPPAGL